jgi:hypothetical protein
MDKLVVAHPQLRVEQVQLELYGEPVDHILQQIQQTHQ